MDYLLLTIYVPETNAEQVKSAVFAAGAGNIGNYSNCCWQTQGLGQFKPLANSSPHVGQINEIHKEPELKIEFIVPKQLQEKVISAIKTSHPYETPAYFLIEIQL